MHSKILPISYGYSWIHDVEILKLNVANHYEVHFFIKPAKKNLIGILISIANLSHFNLKLKTESFFPFQYGNKFNQSGS